MTDETKTIRVNSKTVCPKMAEILNAVDLSGIDEASPDDRMTVAVAFISVGSIIASADGSSAADFAEAADFMANIFADAWAKGQADG